VTDATPDVTALLAERAMEDAPLSSLRRAGSSDEPLLLRVFAESHCDGFELAGLEPSALAGLVRMQFQTRQAQYRTHAGAAEFLICLDSGPAALPVGSCWLADTSEQFRVLDIAVLAEHRRRGVARSVLTSLSVRAARAGKPVRLSVWHANAAALALYRALGFTPADPAGAGTLAGGTGHGPTAELGNGYLELELPAGTAPQLSAGTR
jgi:ribosomal protein S18 acetylase RimI-like enzyme